MWKLTWKWARHSHQNKTGRWVTTRYFGPFNPARQDRWVFGDKHTGAYLRKHCRTRIRRHVMVKGRASPDDPDLAGYWRYRRDKHGTPLDSTAQALLGRQRCCCPLCGDRLIDPGHLPASPEGWQDWWTSVTQRTIRHAPSAPGQQPGTCEATTFLMHTSCYRALQGQRRRNPALQPATP
jgi:RNA-directed DNA polymerase